MSDKGIKFDFWESAKIRKRISSFILRLLDRIDGNNDDIEDYKSYELNKNSEKYCLSHSYGYLKFRIAAREEKEAHLLFYLTCLMLNEYESESESGFSKIHSILYIFDYSNLEIKDIFELDLIVDDDLDDYIDSIFNKSSLDIIEFNRNNLNDKDDIDFEFTNIEKNINDFKKYFERFI